VLVQWTDAVVVHGEPVQVEEGEMTAVPEGNFMRRFSAKRTIFPLREIIAQS
jgi:hypothetical protein